MRGNASILLPLMCILVTPLSGAVGRPRIAPDGTWVGGEPRLAPDGSWVGVEPEGPRGTMHGGLEGIG